MHLFLTSSVHRVWHRSAELEAAGKEWTEEEIWAIYSSDLIWITNPNPSGWGRRLGAQKSAEGVKEE